MIDIDLEMISPINWDWTGYVTCLEHFVRQEVSKLDMWKVIFSLFVYIFSSSNQLFVYRLESTSTNPDEFLSYPQYIAVAKKQIAYANDIKQIISQATTDVVEQRQTVPPPQPPAQQVSRFHGKKNY